MLINVLEITIKIQNNFTNFLILDLKRILNQNSINKLYNGLNGF